MENIVKQLKSLWYSDHLVYKAMSDDQESRDLVFAVLSDSVLANLVLSPSITPTCRTESDNIVSGMVKDALLCVVVTLPAENKQPGGSPAAGKPIGYLQMHRKMVDTGSISSLVILPEYQNNGFGRESLTWLVDWGFRWAGLRRLAVGTVTYNERAMNLYKSIGFIEDGRKREVVYMDTKYWDLVEYSMLLREWKAMRTLEEA